MVDWSSVLAALLSVGVGTVVTYVAAVRLNASANKPLASQ